MLEECIMLKYMAFSTGHAMGCNCQGTYLSQACARLAALCVNTRPRACVAIHASMRFFPVHCIMCVHGGLVGWHWGCLLLSTGMNRILKTFCLWLAFACS